MAPVSLQSRLVTLSRTCCTCIVYLICRSPQHQLACGWGRSLPTLTSCRWTQTRVHGKSQGPVALAERDFSSLVSRCFKPSQPQRITSGLSTNFTLSPSYSFHKSSYHNSCFVLFVFLAYLYFAGTQHGSLHPAGWPILFCGPTQESCVSHSQHRKNQDIFWKKYRWMDRKGRNNHTKQKLLEWRIWIMITVIISYTGTSISRIQVRLGLLNDRELIKWQSSLNSFCLFPSLGSTHPLLSSLSVS